MISEKLTDDDVGVVTFDLIQGFSWTLSVGLSCPSATDSKLEELLTLALELVGNPQLNQSKLYSF